MAPKYQWMTENKANQGRRAATGSFNRNREVGYAVGKNQTSPKAKRGEVEGVHGELWLGKAPPENGGGPASHTPAHDVPAMAAPFRA